MSHARQIHQQAIDWLAQGQAAVVVEVIEIKGSTPREAGARMLVSTDGLGGTIGGGHLEWQALALARQALAESRAHQRPVATWEQSFALGPTLGQCCGGALTLRFSPLSSATLAQWTAPQPRFHLELHGAGHVGQAIIRHLSQVDCTVRWMDQRSDDMPEAGCGLPSADTLAALPSHIQWIETEQPEAEVAAAPANAYHLVLTHRHDLDLRLVQAILTHGSFEFLGLIGSATKHAQFKRRLSERGFTEDQIARITCPIGLPGITGKEPDVIAISVVAQLLQHSSPA